MKLFFSIAATFCCHLQHVALVGAVGAPLRGFRPESLDLMQAHQAAVQHLSFGRLAAGDGSAYFVYGVLAVLTIVILGFTAWGFSQTRSKRTFTVDEEKEEASPLPAAPATEMTEECSEEGSTKAKSIDVEHFLQLLAKRLVHQVGPKLTKANNVRQVLLRHVFGFKQKAVGFVTSELMATVAQLLREADAEEVMILLDPKEAIASHIPPLSIILAGLMSPIVLIFSMIVHLSQVILVLIPVMAMCSWAIYTDWDTLGGCAVPSLQIWVWSQAALSFTLAIAHSIATYNISCGQRSIQEKVADMEGRIDEALADGELSVPEMRELFLIITILLEHSLVVEDTLRQSIWRKVIGIATICWLATTFWTFVIVLGWTFVPGMVAFAESAATTAQSHYCGAWASVLTARLSCVLSLLFLLFNLLTVAQYLADTVIMSEAWSGQWLGMARRFDESMLGLPVMQTVVRAFMLRGSAETLRAQLAAAKSKEVAMEKRKDELKSKILALQSRIRQHRAEAAALQNIAQGSGSSEVQQRVMRMSSATALDAEAMHQLGDHAKLQAQQLEAATKEELDKFYTTLSAAYSAARDSGKEAFDRAQNEMNKGLESVQTAAQGAADSASSAARQAQSSAQSAVQGAMGSK